MGCNIDKTSKTAIILIGGRSTRMGRDKSCLSYHGTSQRKYLYAILTDLGFNVWFSGRKEQKESYMRFLLDENREIGPVSGILSALNNPGIGCALLVGCDQPGIDRGIIEHLWHTAIDAPSHVFMSCYHQPNFNNMPEPLPSVWTVDALSHVQHSVAQKRYALRHIVPSENTLLLPCPDESKLININTPHERQAWRENNAVG